MECGICGGWGDKCTQEMGQHIPVPQNSQPMPLNKYRPNLRLQDWPKHIPDGM